MALKLTKSSYRPCLLKYIGALYQYTYTVVENHCFNSS